MSHERKIAILDQAIAEAVLRISDLDELIAQRKAWGGNTSSAEALLQKMIDTQAGRYERRAELVRLSKEENSS